VIEDVPHDRLSRVIELRQILEREAQIAGVVVEDP
jgi:hypothetical protein